MAKKPRRKRRQFTTTWDVETEALARRMAAERRWTIAFLFRYLLERMDEQERKGERGAA